MDEEKKEAPTPEKTPMAKCCAGACKHKKYILGVIILLLLIGYGVNKKYPDVFGKMFTKNISADEAKEKVKTLIGENSPGVTVKGVAEESGLYKITIGIDKQPDQYAYITKDGTKFIENAISFADIEKKQAEQKKAQEEANRPIEKSDKPAVDLYVMSFCPYGNKSEDTLKSVYDLLKNKATFNFHYIVSSNGDEIQSLHGSKEVIQNEREVCVLKDYGKDKWFAFVAYVNKNCGADGACWEAGARSLAINTAKVNDCVKNEGLALMKENEKASDEANASGSPTMKINGVSSKAVYQYGNSEAYKQAICDAFKTAPAECSKKLSTAAAATGAPASCNPAQ